MGKNAGEMNTAGPEATERIQAEIRHTEADITATLNEIEGRFAPERLKAKAREKVRRYALMSLATVADAVQKKPAVAATIGAGAAWLIIRRFSRRGPEKSAGKSAEAAVKALPENVKRHPVETIRNFLTIGRMVVAAASAVSTFMVREKAQRSRIRTAPAEETEPWRYQTPGVVVEESRPTVK